MSPPKPRTILSWFARLALVAAAGGLYASVDQPYWEMKLHAAQYQQPLTVVAYPDHIEGDIEEIDLLNHYIGMRELGGAAQWERSVGRGAVQAMSGLMVLVAVFSLRWSPLLLAPVVLFPFLFLADLYWWLRDYGLHLDPHAPMNRSIKPFVPTVLGMGKVGQFKTEAWLGPGMYLALAAAAVAILFAVVRWRWWLRKAGAGEAASVTVPALKQPAAVAVALACLASPAAAETWRVNPGGSLTSIAEAVARATEGDTIEVEGGHYAGPLVINKRLTLLGRNWPVIDGGGQGTVVTLSAPGSRFEGFQVCGSGRQLANEDGDGGILATAERAVIVGNRLDDVLFGISLRMSHRSQVRGNVLRGKRLDMGRRGDLVRLWWSHDVVVEDNDIAAGRDLVLWYSRHLTVRNNRVRDGRYGIHFMYCDDAQVVDNTFENNSVGSFLMYSRGVHLERNWIEHNRGASGYGVGLKDMESYVVSGNMIVNNRTGVFIEGAQGELRGNLIGYNERGITIFTSCHDNNVVDNAFVDNGEQVVVEGNATLAESNHWRANFWNDYRGLDGDGDGRGDQPYRPRQLFERLTDRNSGMKLFADGVAAEAIDYAARMFPVFEPRVKFTDPAPRMAAPAPPLTRRQQIRWPFLPLGALLLLGAVACFSSRVPRADAVAIPDPTPLADTTAVAVRVARLSKRFGAHRVLTEVSFEIRAGEAVALWGANGAGKTTLIRCLLGLIPCEGECSVLGRPCGLAGKESRRLLGYVPQDVKIRGDHTVLGCLKFYAALRGVSVERGKELLAGWGLGDVHDRSLRQLSGGMLQKLALVLALLSDPPVLLLDEPTSNLDVAAREEFGRLLARLKAAGKTLVFCTHRPGEIMSLADRVVVLEGGQVVAQGTPQELGPRLLRPAVLRLTVAPDQRAAAVAALRESGFSARGDGGEVWLDVPAGRKSEAIGRLQAAGIRLYDFDIESDRGFQA